MEKGTNMGQMILELTGIFIKKAFKIIFQLELVYLCCMAGVNSVNKQTIHQKFLGFNEVISLSLCKVVKILNPVLEIYSYLFNG